MIEDTEVKNGKIISGATIIALCEEADIDYRLCIGVEITPNSATFTLAERGSDKQIQVCCFISWNRPTTTKKETTK